MCFRKSNDVHVLRSSYAAAVLLLTICGVCRRIRTARLTDRHNEADSHVSQLLFDSAETHFIVTGYRRLIGYL
jgi:hypothetical protein